ncbi:flavodoxin reductase [Sphingobacterium sp. N143]|uniref:flavodoxin reductase n=1 Tax=Sphingobacterium sp. N143 TaxID=2746727 RepID=UPI002578FB85|nr:flavodoxin reductase [Sphingobacterium sp. N143]MDM1294956.1 flavodoxin reductase [Sphingobacterium sp. N143]
MASIVKIISTNKLTHDVLHITTEKPDCLLFLPGQAADISINKPGWTEWKNPFTFTSLPGDNTLEFTIKIYPEHNGVTKELLTLVPGDELIIQNIFGTIRYKGDGIFIAGGAGVTPFLSILKDLYKENKISGNKLILANKTRNDIIVEGWLSKALESNFINILSEEHCKGYAYGYITKQFIQQHVDARLQYYYICGPEPMIKSVIDSLLELGIDKKQIIQEKF